MNAEKLSTIIARCIKALFDTSINVTVTRPEETFGDYATNVALQLAGRLHKKPREIAEAIANELRKVDQIKTVTIAGPGFINLTLPDQVLAAAALQALAVLPKTYENQVVVAEYSDPNPFKILHAGHLYTSIVGDAIANLMEKAGGEVHRVNFGGDVGLHVGKTMWAMLKDLGGEHPEKLADIQPDKRAEWMTNCYIKGTAAYEADDATKASILQLNKRVYQVHAENDTTSPFAQLYWTCRQWSYDYFDVFYARIGSRFEKYYPESTTAVVGAKTVKAHIGDVFEQSQGAIIFKGEKYGLHTRVFINSEGIPTYEAKDVGLIMKKWQDYHFDRSVIITGNEQEQYMAVVLKAIEQFAPELVKGSIHLTHGIVKLQGGVKMSSRKGNILRAVDVLDSAALANKQATGQDNEQTVLAAVKYAFLKQRTGPDIIYNPAESVSLEGNSGPYLQYAYARACSIVRKAGGANELTIQDLEADERSLARKITEYPEVIERATSELMPHYVCTYLYELAQSFNRFYEHNRVIGSQRQAMRIALVQAYRQVLADGLELLGIEAPEQL